MQSYHRSLFAHYELTQRKSDFFTSLALMTNASQLYAEPSLILYIRTKFDLSNVVIVSPDAGGAKRCVTYIDDQLERDRMDYL